MSYADVLVVSIVVFGLFIALSFIFAALEWALKLVMRCCSNKPKVIKGAHWVLFLLAIALSAFSVHQHLHIATVTVYLLLILDLSISSSRDPLTQHPIL